MREDGGGSTGPGQEVLSSGSTEVIAEDLPHWRQTSVRPYRNFQCPRHLKAGRGGGAMGAMTTCGTKRRATCQSAMVATLTCICKRACKQGCPSGRRTSGSGQVASAAEALLPGATGKRHRRQTQPLAAGPRSWRADCLVWWTAPGKWPHKDRAKGAQRPVPHTDRRQAEQDNLQLVPFCQTWPRGGAHCR